MIPIEKKLKFLRVAKKIKKISEVMIISIFLINYEFLFTYLIFILIFFIIFFKHSGCSKAKY